MLKKYILILIIMIMSFIFLIYRGHFLFLINYNRPEKIETKVEPNIEPYKYKFFNFKLGNTIQRVNIAEVNLNNPHIRISPVLSYDSIGGFEKLSEISLRKKAKIAINGGFFTQDGIPLGMVMIDNKLFSKPSYQFPVFIIKNRHASIVDLNKSNMNQIGEYSNAYECGSWLLKDNLIVAPDKDNLVGALTNRDPRTAIGIKNSKEVVLVTVDGRQPGYSDGLTAKELAKLLLDYGLKDAAMLDGGASTQMIIHGKMVNRPSGRGKERSVGGAFIVY